MDVFDVRYQNFRTLIDEKGDDGKAIGISGAASRLGKSQSQVSHFGGERPIKNIGPKVARQIEEAFGKPRGWLDASHDGASAASQEPRLDDDKLERSIQFLERQFATWGREFVAVRNADLIAGVYARIGRKGETNLVTLSQWLMQRVEEKGLLDEGARGTGRAVGSDR